MQRDVGEEQKRTFAKNLKHYTEMAGLQQKELAEIIGEKTATINKWFMGKSMPHMGKIQRLADYFGIGKSDLVDDHEFTEEKERRQLEVLSLFNALEEKEQEIILTTMRALVTRKDS